VPVQTCCFKGLVKGYAVAVPFGIGEGSVYVEDQGFWAWHGGNIACLYVLRRRRERDYKVHPCALPFGFAALRAVSFEIRSRRICRTQCRFATLEGSNPES